MPITLERGRIKLNIKASSIRTSSKGIKRVNEIRSLGLRIKRRVTTTTAQKTQYKINKIIKFL